MSLFSRLCAVVSGNDFDDEGQDLGDELDEELLRSAGHSSSALGFDMPDTSADDSPFDQGNVIGMPGIARTPQEVVVMEPRSFSEMPLAIQALRERKTIILNLRMMDPHEAQRAVDFVSGGTFATDGKQERVGDSIFIFAPSCVNVTLAESVSEDDTAPTAEHATSTAPASDPRSRSEPVGVAPHPAWNHHQPVSTQRGRSSF